MGWLNTKPGGLGGYFIYGGWDYKLEEANESRVYNLKISTVVVLLLVCCLLSVENKTLVKRPRRESWDWFPEMKCTWRIQIMLHPSGYLKNRCLRQKHDPEVWLPRHVEHRGQTSSWCHLIWIYNLVVLPKNRRYLLVKHIMEDNWVDWAVFWWMWG